MAWPKGKPRTRKVAPSPSHPPPRAVAQRPAPFTVWLHVETRDSRGDPDVDCESFHRVGAVYATQEEARAYLESVVRLTQQQASAADIEPGELNRMRASDQELAGMIEPDQERTEDR